MSKKIVAISALLVIFATTVPAYAQSPIPSMPPVHQGNGGFLGEVESFFGNFFHQHNSNGGSSQNQTFQNQNVSPEAGAPSGMMQPNPSGMPDYTSMQQRRLSYLVQLGKITQAQEQAILAEQTSVQNELKTWAESQGINPEYVLGGPIGGFGQSEKQGGLQNNSDQSGQHQQFHPMTPQGQSGSQQGGQYGQHQQQGQGL